VSLSANRTFHGAEIRLIPVDFVFDEPEPVPEDRVSLRIFSSHLIILMPLLGGRAS
jgi:hypothetical protein